MYYIFLLYFSLMLQVTAWSNLLFIVTGPT